MLVGLAGLLSGYDGSFEFKSGEVYPDTVPYVAKRVMLATFGVLMVPLPWFTSVEASGTSLATLDNLWAAGVVCLIVVPTLVFMASLIHYLILNHSGPGDSQMSSLFWVNLEGDDFHKNLLWFSPLSPLLYARFGKLTVASTSSSHLPVITLKTNDKVTSKIGGITGKAGFLYIKQARVSQALRPRSPQQPGWRLSRRRESHSPKDSGTRYQSGVQPVTLACQASALDNGASSHQQWTRPSSSSSDKKFPDEAVLIQRVFSSNELCQDEGIAFLRWKLKRVETANILIYLKVSKNKDPHDSSFSLSIAMSNIVEEAKIPSEIKRETAPSLHLLASTMQWATYVITGESISYWHISTATTLIPLQNKGSPPFDLETASTAPSEPSFG
ncbi:hypothetical protein DFP72DRAFT_1107908 [Ephemerocybe angulata]|uniref:ArnT-like N-terminal domain-containing protein n=1 Tax=Ephemerocybe angulata TaxID=980116 RepID=A0A8H6MG94_9AGAR|nr:hypothetical protein DFP72DRAFT_1107908 [Tulosesus angulatus]